MNYLLEGNTDFAWFLVRMSISAGYNNAHPVTQVEIVNFEEHQKIGATGVCPHCRAKSLLSPVGAPHKEKVPGTEILRIGNIAKCEACKEYVLLTGQMPIGDQSKGWKLRSVHPLGAPSQEVSEAVPEGIADDFREALRCQFARSFKAAVVMCLRAIQAAAIDKGAPSRARLVEQIDDLATRGIITVPVKEWAHEIRSAGNDGAHPGEDGLACVAEADADEIIEFTSAFFAHLYVMPGMLEKRRQARNSPGTSPSYCPP